MKCLKTGIRQEVSRLTSGCLGLLTLKDKLNYFSVTFTHKSIQAFYLASKIHKQCASLHRTALTATADTTGQRGCSCRFQNSKEEDGWTCECRSGQLRQQICASWLGTFPSLNSNVAVSSHGGGEIPDKCLLLNECNIPIFSTLMFSTLMFSLVGATVMEATGEQPVSPQPQSPGFM